MTLIITTILENKKKCQKKKKEKEKQVSTLLPRLFTGGEAKAQRC